MLVKEKRLDWDLISQEYIEAPTEAARPSLEALARKYDVSYTYLRKKSAAGKWRSRANQYLAALAKERTRLQIEKRMVDIEMIDCSIVQLTKGLLDRIASTLQRDEALGVREIQGLCTSLKTLSELTASNKGDIFTSLMTLVEEEILTQNQVNQVAYALSESDRGLQDRIALIIGGNCPD